MACRIIWEDKGVLMSHSGTVTNQEVIEMNDLMYGDERFEKITYQIADYTNVTRNLITPTNAKVVGILDKTSSRWASKNMRIAIVTTDYDFLPSVNVYFKELEATNWEVRVFETLELAHAWVLS